MWYGWKKTTNPKIKKLKQNFYLLPLIDVKDLEKLG